MLERASNRIRQRCFFSSQDQLQNYLKRKILVFSFTNFWSICKDCFKFLVWSVYFLKGVSSPNFLYCENVFKAPYNKTSSNFVLKKSVFLDFLAFRDPSRTSFGHNCDIPKPELLHPKSRTVNNLNGCGFEKQHLWFWDVTVLEKRCVVWILESQKLNENRFVDKKL